MCGITGFVGRGSESDLSRMTKTLRHRGPDDLGIYFADGVGLGHTRLSIIDLSGAGHQPMWNAAKTIGVVFNGEIYNFLELKKTLVQKGRRFTSNSDTEVIIALYEEVGERCFERLEGMFAIALYDKDKKKLILARDRMGKKPLYYGVLGQTLLFGSEMKALMSHPEFTREIDAASLNKYFQYEYVPTPHTMFEGIFKLEPGHYALYDGRVLTKTKFWDVSFLHKNEKEITFNDALVRFNELLYDGVRKRLVSDVPLGVFLSGGIDSSTVAYYAQKIARDTGTKPIQTFSIGFTEDTFDESTYARRVAARLGTAHHEKILSAKDSLRLIPTIADLLDEPLADASLIPTYLLSRFAREHVTVALGGDGGDELLSGYDTFIAHRFAGIYEKVPEILRKQIIERMTPLLPSSRKNMSLDFKIKKFIAGFYGEKKYRNQRWLGAFDKAERAGLFNEHIRTTIENLNEFEDIDRYLGGLSTDDYYDQLTYLYLRTYMMDDILVKVDRASMYNSLEVRAPFLDTAVVEFLVNLPLSFKLHGFTTKHLLKRLMENKLPRDIVYRKKKGFGIPLAEWLSNELKPMALDLLSEERLNQQGLFNVAYTKTLLDDHFSARRDNRKPIWTLLIFQMWYDRWCV